MRLIDADELKETLHETIEDDPRVKWWYDLIGIDDAIDFSPTITFDPPKHGRWVHEHIGKYAIVRCSECKSQAPMWKTNYCPDCGALMDKEADDETD